MSAEAADFLLAGLERNMPPKTVIFITCNSDKWASKALKSRLMVVTFDGNDPELKREAAARLGQIWDIETGRRRPAPNFASFASVGREEPLNMRSALNRVEQAIMLLDEVA